MVVKDTKINLNMENKSWLSIEKNIIKSEKALSYNYKKLFSFKVLFSFPQGLAGPGGQARYLGKYRELSW